MTEPVPVGEARETRLKRLHMRSMRRGIKEMDIILSRFSQSLPQLSDSDLDAYDQVLAQNDQDLYQWVSGQEQPPASLAPMISRIAGYN
ncbi:succinate dehydrogenase assembly factor 2 [Pseudooceanicola sediminis]|mgnify:CR=1 FL=1|uniref:FAD assembly factor SdhE n=1 Tax=Pseudooceanicola sediminis TaxID=2211117 RepID=A0A399J3S4_9RHOB|nr:succinate dehydrogenase assembly factor 2 [Pseudooceanicola sediminis]KAA2314155.1 succinate dehydrogenase assembly factor 2 [Puniceibacterium sp. HSS470]RII39985.1 succinate dehydrogenase assembly factor 2 [Pseudooceanicola sediminis]|tara:strand:+ start:46994 stop:47260 length:267 start_codon:yes stop_codon:yes gene_type:complete